MSEAIETDFDKAFDRLFRTEGGFTDNPKDPGNWTGGRVGIGQCKGTKYGIAANTYPDLDIKNLTRDGAKAIYYRDFWSQLLDAHPAVRYQAFDFAVNSGMSTAKRKLQVAVGVADDGHWGPLSASALAQMDLNDVLMRYMAQRLRYWARCSALKMAAGGWMNRAAEMLDYATQDN